MNSEKSFDFFLKNDFSTYKENEWIAICGSKIVAHGETLKKVILDSKKNCNDRPLFTRVKKAAYYLHC
jgi:hypothetical protein